MFLKKHSVNVVEAPCQSSDLNPTEDMWLLSHDSCDLTELEQFYKEERGKCAVSKCTISRSMHMNCTVHKLTL